MFDGLARPLTTNSVSATMFLFSQVLAKGLAKLGNILRKHSRFRRKMFQSQFSKLRGKHVETSFAFETCFPV